MRLKKRTFVLLGVMVVAIAAAIGAYAYFTSTGAGTGTATVGHDTAFVLYGSAAGTAYPGESQDVTFTVDNPGGGNQKLGTIHLDSIAACTAAWDLSVAGDPECNSGGSGLGDISTSDCGSVNVDTGSGNAANKDFYMADVPVNHDYAPGTGLAVTPHGTLVFNDLSHSQDGCKDAYLLLNLSAAQSS